MLQKSPLHFPGQLYLQASAVSYLSNIHLNFPYWFLHSYLYEILTKCINPAQFFKFGSRGLSYTQFNGFVPSEHLPPINALPHPF
jgi:hypothetical protein